MAMTPTVEEALRAVVDAIVGAQGVGLPFTVIDRYHSPNIESGQEDGDLFEINLEKVEDVTGPPECPTLQQYTIALKYTHRNPGSSQGETVAATVKALAMNPNVFCFTKRLPLRTPMDIEVENDILRFRVEARRWCWPDVGAGESVS